jgi:hypothetical protein
MTGWQIDPHGVQSILTLVETDRGELNTALGEDKFAAIFDGLTWGGAVTAEVPNAVNGLLQDQMRNLTNIGNRINAGVVGVSNATVAYNNGQYDMCSTFQSEMLESAETGDFQYFVENGYEA